MSQPPKRPHTRRRLPAPRGRRSCAAAPAPFAPGKTAGRKSSFLSRARGGQLQAFPWGAIRWLCNAQLQPGCEQTLGLVYINPGQNNGTHLHPNCEELLYVISGECQHSLDRETFSLRAGDLLRIPRGVRHGAVNRGWEPLRLLVCYSSPRRETEGQETR